VFALGKWDGFTNQITQSHLANKQTEVLITLHLQSAGKAVTIKIIDARGIEGLKIIRL